MIGRWWFVVLGRTVEVVCFCLLVLVDVLVCWGFVVLGK